MRVTEGLVNLTIEDKGDGRWTWKIKPVDIKEILSTYNDWLMKNGYADTDLIEEVGGYTPLDEFLKENKLSDV